MRVPRNLDCTRPGDRSLLSWSKKVSTQPKFPIWMRRETLRDDSLILVGDIKNYPDERKVVVPWNIDPLFWKCPVLVEFLWFVFNYIRNLSTSLFLCANIEFGCYWFVLQNWRIPHQNGNRLLRIEALHGTSILSLQIELIERSVFIILGNSSVIYLIIAL